MRRNEPGIDEAEKDRADLHRSRHEAILPWRINKPLFLLLSRMVLNRMQRAEPPGIGSFGDYRQYCDVPIHGSEVGAGSKTTLNSIRMRLQD